MYPVRKVLSLATAVANGVSLSQTPSAGGSQALLINGSLTSGGVATFDVARRVIITSAGNDSTLTFKITGTNRDGILQRENVTGANATVAVSKKDFLTVTQILVSGNTAAAVTAGTNGQASTNWIATDQWRRHISGVAVIVRVLAGSTLNYTVEDTGDDIQNQDYISDAAQYILALPNAPLTAQTASGEGGYAVPPTAIRLTFNSYTTGSAQITVQ